MIAWRAYYTNGARFTSKEDEPATMPKDGMLGVVKYLSKQTHTGQPYRHILSGDDYYLFWNGEWFSNSDSPEDNERRYPGCILIRGKWVPSEEMDRVQREMAEAKEAP